MQKNYKVGQFILDNHQMKVLTTINNCIVIAGAGSGKTLTILGKINYLIENNICHPEEILVISFTNASVNDIKEKIKYSVEVFTFHKLAMNILQKSKFQYSICPNNILKYTISEYIKSLTLEEQQDVLNFLKLHINFKKFLYSEHFKSFCKLIETFINIFKSNDFCSVQILKIKFTKLEKRVLLIVFKIYQIYLTEKKSTNLLDLDDLIIYATKLTNKVNLNYKYIIIDEFQDTSFIRLNLIKEISKFSNCKIVVVGDDWQSIYRFSGCDLNIFLNFSQQFYNVDTITLVNTYRNSLQLISIASEFITKNKKQINKKLSSVKSNETPLIFVPFVNKIEKLKKLLNHLLTITNSIMILARNKNDINSYIDNDFNINNNDLYFRDKKIKFYTVHKSKGLEADYVIVINCDNNILGFPNKIENNKIINKLTPSIEIPYAEERRLFYVAITRCKESTFLMYDKYNASFFIKEIKKITKKQLHKITYFM